MKTYLVALVATLALVGAAPAASSDAPSPTAHASCTSALIVGQRKCIGAGQFCQHTARANRDYHRYGFHCGKTDRNGRYHLVYR